MVIAHSAPQDAHLAQMEFVQSVKTVTMSTPTELAPCAHKDAQNATEAYLHALSAMMAIS